jgi:hypothetical protein
MSWEYDPDVEDLSKKLRFAGMLIRAGITGDPLKEILQEYRDDMNPTELADTVYPYLVANKMVNKEGWVLKLLRSLAKNMRYGDPK